MDVGASDWDLLEVAPFDDGQAVARLFDRHRHYVYRVAWGLLADAAAADDVVQDVFLKLRSRKARGKPGARFTTWLYQVAINTAREHARNRRRFWGTAPAEDVLAAMPDTTQDPDARDAIKDLSHALHGLPLRQREVVLLRYYEGFSTEKTAEILGCRAGTVKAHLHRATQFLKTNLTNEPTPSPKQETDP